LAGGVIEQPSDLNEQQSIGEIDPVERLVLDMVKAESLVEGIGLFEAGGHCLTRVQGAGKSVGQDGARNSPKLSSALCIKGAQRVLIGAKVCFELLTADRHASMLASQLGVPSDIG
jgi:hypothetical protein